MLDHKGFDLWADGYDKTVGLSEESNTYPFAGYKNVLGTIYSGVRAANASMTPQETPSLTVLPSSTAAQP